MSETLVVFTVAVAVACAYRLLLRPTIARAVALGVAVAVVTLTRAEAVLLVPLLAVPACLVAAVPGRRRAVLAVVAVAGSVVTLAPWTLYNLSRFEKPVVLGTGFGALLLVANCDQTYSGPRLGSWYYPCFATGGPIAGDPSQYDTEARRRALRYVRHHAGRVPEVVLAREGRTWGVFRPRQQLLFDSQESSRPLAVARVGLIAYYALGAAGVVGAVLLRRRGVWLFPFLAVVVDVVVAAAIGFGQTRYRAPAEVAIVVLAAVAVDRWWARWGPGSGRSVREPHVGAGRST
jgi:hypothetical protein